MNLTINNQEKSAYKNHSNELREVYDKLTFIFLLIILSGVFSLHFHFIQPIP